MKVLCTGASGQLGRAVVDAARRAGDEVVGLSHADLAVEDADATRRAVAHARPDFVIHCAAWTDVDGCEADPERADSVNGHGTADVAEACRSVGAGLCYVSTDFVFAGDAREPYPVDAAPGPLSAYGRSKLLGESAVLGDLRPGFFVVRTSWVFGPGGRNFPATILERARQGGPLRVVRDQVGRPTLTCDLAEALCDLCRSGAPAGVYHAANEGQCSWHRFAEEILREAGLLDVEVFGIESRELDRPALRPAYSVLDCSRLTAVRGRALPDYHDALSRYLAAEAEQEAEKEEPERQREQSPWGVDRGPAEASP